jgi:protein-tyrosine phosphatase
MKILMVCLGNICRSPMAHGILQKLLVDNNLNWTVESRGTNGYHTGEPPHEFSIKVCKQNGIDISMQKSERLSLQDLIDFDIIYALANDVKNDIENIKGSKPYMHKVKLFMNELEPGSNKNVTDPWYGNEEGYTPVFKTIYNVCEAIIENYKN